MSGPYSPYGDEPTQRSWEQPQPPRYWTSAGEEYDLPYGRPTPQSEPPRKKMPWGVIGAVVGLAVIAFLLVMVLAQRFENGTPSAERSSAMPPVAEQQGSSSRSGPSTSSPAFPAGLSRQCLSTGNGKMAIPIDRVQLQPPQLASCPFVEKVRDEVDRRGVVQAQYAASIYSQYLADHQKPAWVVLTCTPEQGFTVCRGGDPKVEIWVAPKS